MLQVIIVNLTQHFFAVLHSNALKMLRRIEEIKLKNKNIPEELIRKIDIPTSYSLKFRDPEYEDSDYVVDLNDGTEFKQ